MGLYKMTMNFYIGKEYKSYARKFKKIQKFVRNRLKTGSMAETFRWMVNEMYNSIITMEKKKDGEKTEK